MTQPFATDDTIMLTTRDDGIYACRLGETSRFVGPFSNSAEAMALAGKMLDGWTIVDMKKGEPEDPPSDPSKP